MAIPEYEIVDIETTIRNTGEDSVGKLKASPFYPDNETVITGFRSKKGTFISWDDNIRLYNDTKLLVGQNIKFDLLWLLRRDEKYWRDWLHFNAP